MLRLVGLWQQFQQANLSVQRLGDLMNAPDRTLFHHPQPIKRRQRTIESKALASVRRQPALPLRRLQAQGRPRQSRRHHGPSGSGKSTFTKLLQGFYQPAGGTIKIDGNDIRYLSANELRHYFGVVPQETVLFSGTLYDNLLMANPHASFESSRARLPHGRNSQRYRSPAQGYQTEIGERGVGLSGGQKQRIAIARALIKATQNTHIRRSHQQPRCRHRRTLRHHQPAQGQSIDAVYYPCHAEEFAGG